MQPAELAQAVAVRKLVAVASRDPAWPSILTNAMPMTPLEKIPRAPTPAMKSLARHEDQQTGPSRTLATLSITEALGLSEVKWPMLVEERQPGHPLRRTLWCAPSEPEFSAANHGDPAPTDEALRARGWLRCAGEPVNGTGAAEEPAAPKT